MTNWGAHHLDIARWIVGAKGPLMVSGAGGRYALKDGGQTPDVQQVTYQFPGVVVSWTTSEIGEGDPFTLNIYGTKGMMSLTRAGFKVKPEMASKPGTKEKTPLMEPLQVQGGNIEEMHMRKRLDCVKSRNRPNADVEEGHLTAVMCHLGNISTRLDALDVGCRERNNRERRGSEQMDNAAISRSVALGCSFESVTLKSLRSCDESFFCLCSRLSCFHRMRHRPCADLHSYASGHCYRSVGRGRVGSDR